ncbi:MAG: BTAD domain-containing putative transcriptional regulator [Myxococcota bacterium]
MESRRNDLAVTVLGGTALTPSDAAWPRPLPAKLAALLAVLALDGPTSRSRLATLLWPDAPEATGRNNLAQSLRRLRLLADGQVVVRGRDLLQLGANVRVDARDVLAAHAAGRLDECAAQRGALLGDVALRDCDDFADWLAASRYRLDRLRAAACVGLSERAEAAGDAREALDWAERAVELEPCGERAWRRLIRLHHERGDRAAALAAFARCERVFERELGAAPSPRTRRLVERVRGRSAAFAPATHGATRGGPPPRLLLPLPFTGRSEIWAEMEAAWSRGAAIFLVGPPGIGKSRLLREFLAAKGAPFVFEGRPGDAHVPYATHARTYRQMLEAFPSLELPAWVAGELARLLPGRRADGAPSRELDALRFVQAQTEATRLAVAAGMRCVGVDDLQFVDRESLRAGYHVYSPHWGRTDGMRTILCYREGELADEATALLDGVLATGNAVRLALGPIAAPPLVAMLEGLGLGLEARAEELVERSGGNPLFLLELVRHLFERAHDDGRPEDVPPRIRQLVSARIARVSDEARDLLRIAALAGDRFGAAVAARVLEIPLVRLSEPWAELESAQLLRGERIVHDLVLEVARDAVPPPLLDDLKRRIAASLEELDA